MNTPALFDTVLLPADLDDLPAPANGPYFVATRNGYFVHKSFHFGRLLVPMDDNPGLPANDNAILWKEIPKLPAPLVGQAWSFFRAIWEARHSEAMVDITWSEKHGYRLFVPPQQATGAAVSCKRNPEHYAADSIHVGTIHSHCDFGAFHSGTDTHDADDHDGLHITIGHVDHNPPELALMIAASQAHWPVEIDEVIDGPLSLVRHPAWWERFVSDPIPVAHIVRDYQSSWGDANTKPWKPSQHPTGKYTPKPVSKVITGQYKRPGSYTSIAELAYASIESEQFTAKDLDALEKAETHLDEATRILDNMNLDLDYEISLQIGSPIGHASLIADMTDMEWERLAKQENQQ